MNTSVKTGLICAAGAVAIGAAATGIVTAVRVAKKKKAINYKEKIEAYKEAEKTNTVTEEIKAEAEEAKAEVKAEVKKEIIENAKTLGTVAVVGFGVGYAGGFMYEAGKTAGKTMGKLEGVASFAGVNEYCLENGFMKTKDLKPGFFIENAKDFVKDFADTETQYFNCKLNDGFEDAVDEIANLAKEVCSSVAENAKEVIA